MKTSSKFTIRTLLAATGLAIILGGLAAAPASAEEWRHDRDFARAEHFRHEQEWRHHVRYEHRYAAPGYGYAPPRAAYAAPSLRPVFPPTFR